MSKKTYTLYLSKPDVQAFEDALTENARAVLQARTTEIIEAPDLGDGGKLFIFSGTQHAPKWLRDLQADFPVTLNLKVHSACAVLMFRAAGRLFAVSFAHGWMYLDDSKLEGDFGLRVAINALDETKLKRLERANLADALRGVSLSPFSRDFRSFGLNDALDLVRKISGTTRDEATAEAIVGSRSLKLSSEYKLTELPELADELLAFFTSDDYKNTGFRVLDFVSPIVDTDLIEALDELVVEIIKITVTNLS